MGWAMAMLVEIVMLPFEFVEVTATWTATGVVGKNLFGTGKGEMIMLSDAAVGGFSTTGSILVVGCGAAGTSFAAEIMRCFVAGVVVVVGTSPGASMVNGASVCPIRFTGKEKEAVFGGSALGVDVSAGTAFCDCATGGCVIDAEVSIEVGKPSGSVDVDVVVRYNAVDIAIAGPTQSPVASQFQMPKPGKRFSMRFPVSPHVSSPTGRKVQPLGSLIVLTPVVCTPSGRSG